MIHIGKSMAIYKNYSSSIAIGSAAASFGSSSIAIGSSTRSFGSNSISIGFNKELEEKRLKRKKLIKALKEL